jgi:DNA-binding NarL/FixJ family response regulator
LSGLHERFPKLNIVAISLTDDYPLDLAMAFMDNGVKSYVNYWDGHDEFYRAINVIKEGLIYIPSHLKDRRLEFGGDLKTKGYLTDREFEIMRLICNGWKSKEVGDRLQICKNTVDNSKTAIFKALGVRNEREMLIKVLQLKIFNVDDLRFRPPNYEYLTLPNKSIGEGKNDY